MTRRSVATTAAMVLLSLLGAACGGDDDVPSATTGTTRAGVIAGGTTTTAPGDPSATSTTVEGSPDTSEAPADTTAPEVTTPVTAPPVTAAPGPAALTPAAPGIYNYATSGTSTFNGTASPFPAVTTNFVDPPFGNRQHASRNLRDAAGNGALLEYIFEYRADGVYLVTLKITTSFSGYTDTRDLTPAAPLLFLATGAAPGASRQLDIPVPTGGTAHVVVDVLGTEPVTIAGQALDTLIVRSVATLPPGQITGTQALTVNVHPASRLWVRERGTSDASVAGALTVHTDYTATLLSLTPG